MAWVEFNIPCQSWVQHTMVQHTKAWKITESTRRLLYALLRCPAVLLEILKRATEYCAWKDSGHCCHCWAKSLQWNCHDFKHELFVDGFLDILSFFKKVSESRNLVLAFPCSIYNGQSWWRLVCPWQCHRWSSEWFNMETSQGKAAKHNCLCALNSDSD